EAAGLLDAFRSRLDAERRELLEAHFGSFDGLSNADRARLEKMTEELVRRIVEMPSGRLRQARKLKRPVEGLAALRELFGLDDSEDDRLKGKSKP
ncbi:MAG TPA: hypothetical protein VGT03_07610, partial [Candidatus Acidoferrales bacterium]|nr:hypothetical protein [Candidatus Acidoferrales bacterium]